MTDLLLSESWSHSTLFWIQREIHFTVKAVFVAYLCVFSACMDADVQYIHTIMWKYQVLLLLKAESILISMSEL